MGSGHAGKGMGQATTTNQGGGRANPRLPHENDMDLQVKGNNQLHGNDQSQIHNERHSMAGETTRTQGVVESFELQDKEKRAAAMKKGPR